MRDQFICVLQILPDCVQADCVQARLVLYGQRSMRDQLYLCFTDFARLCLNPEMEMENTESGNGNGKHNSVQAVCVQALILERSSLSEFCFIVRLCFLDTVFEISSISEFSRVLFICFLQINFEKSIKEFFNISILYLWFAQGVFSLEIQISVSFILILERTVTDP